MKILVILVIIALVVFFGVAFGLARFVTGGHRQDYEEAITWQKNHYDISWYDQLKQDQYTVTMEDGYVIHAKWLHNPQEGTKFVILTHGYTDNNYGMMKYMRIWLDLGYQIIAYDLRGHGANAKHICTYSLKEGHDLAEMIADTRKRHPELTQLGIQGESLGSASSIRCLEYHPQIDFCVADCGFADIRNVVANECRRGHLPGFLVGWANLGMKMYYHVSMDQMQPILALQDNQVPILFIHGEEDPFVVPENSIRMQKAAKSYSEIHLVPKADHAASVLRAPEHYREYVSQFLKKCGLA